jgi:cyanate permease
VGAVCGWARDNECVTALLASVAAPPLALDEDKVSPGLLGFIIVALLALATWFLLRSMNNQMRKVNFEERDRSTGERGTGDDSDES